MIKVILIGLIGLATLGVVSNIERDATARLTMEQARAADDACWRDLARHGVVFVSVGTSCRALQVLDAITTIDTTSATTLSTMTINATTATTARLR